MKIRFVLFLVFGLVLVQAAFGASALKAVLMDIEAWEKFEETAPVREVEQSKVNYSYNSDNVINSRDLTLNGTDSKLDIILPLQNKSVFGITRLKSASFFQLNYEDGGVDLSDQSDVYNLFYTACLTNYCDIGVGVNQRQSAEKDADGNLGYSYSVGISPSETFSIKYNSERSDTGVMTGLNSGGGWSFYPALSALSSNRLDLSARLGNRLNLKMKYQTEASEPYQPQALNYGAIGGRGEKAEILTVMDFSDKVKFKGKLGKRDENQSIKIYDDGNDFAYFRSDKADLFGVLGIVYCMRDADFSFNLFKADIGLSGKGSSLSEYVPDMLSNIGNVDKAVNVESKLSMSGCNMGLNRRFSDRLYLNGSISYISALLNGSANIWNSFFFGMAKQLDQSYDLPFSRVDFLQAGFGLKYAVSDGMELNYALKQLIPVFAEKSAQNAAGDPTGNSSDVSVASGGNSQTFSLTYYF